MEKWLAVNGEAVKETGDLGLTEPPRCLGLPSHPTVPTKLVRRPTSTPDDGWISHESSGLSLAHLPSHQPSNLSFRASHCPCSPQWNFQLLIDWILNNTAGSANS